MKKILIVLLLISNLLYADFHFEKILKYQDNKFEDVYSLIKIDNKIYSTDNDHKYIQVFNEQYSFLNKIKIKRFDTPSDILYYKNKIFVCDSDKGIIFVLDKKWNLLYTIGKRGSKEGYLKKPVSIKYNSAGRLYIADEKRGKILVYNDEGIFFFEFGTKDLLDKIRGIVIDSEDNVFVLDVGNRDIKKFDKNGKLLKIFSGKGRADDKLKDPTSIVIDRENDIYVSDADNYKIVKFNNNGKYLMKIGTKGKHRGQFRNLKGIFIIKDELIAIDDKNDNIQIFNLNLKPKQKTDKYDMEKPVDIRYYKTIKAKDNLIFMKFLDENKLILINKDENKINICDLKQNKIVKSYGSYGKKEGQFKRLLSLCKNNNGEYLLSDGRLGKISVFTKDFKFKSRFLSRGSKPGYLKYPLSLSVNSKGIIAVADNNNDRVDLFNKDWIYINSIKGEFNNEDLEPFKITFDDKDNLFILDSENGNLIKYDTTKNKVIKILKDFSHRRGLAIDSEDNIYMSDEENSRIYIYNNDLEYKFGFGKYGENLKEFIEPTEITVYKSRYIAVYESEKERIQIFKILVQPKPVKTIKVEPGFLQNKIEWEISSKIPVKYYNLYLQTEEGVKLLETTQKTSFIHNNLKNNTEYLYFVTEVSYNDVESKRSDIIKGKTLQADKILLDQAILNYKKQNYDSSLIDLNKALKYVKDNPEIYFYKGLVFYKLNKIKKSIELLKKAISINPLDKYRKKLEISEKKFDELYNNKIEIDIVKVEFEKLFPAIYKYYSTKDIAEITLKNNSDKLFSDVKLSFMIKQYMDFPTEIKVKELKPKKEMILKLPAELNNKILEIDEPTNLQTEIKVTYYKNGKEFTNSITKKIEVYSRNSIVWDENSKVAAFITPNDYPVKVYARKILNLNNDFDYVKLPESLKNAVVLFDSLISKKIRYIKDPNNGYLLKTKNIDSVQFSRDTLKTLTGDCDDLSVLYNSMLESIGLQTSLIFVPDHIFVAFNTKIEEKDFNKITSDKKKVLFIDGKVWIPVEITDLTSSFLKAWSVAASEIEKWNTNNKVEIIKTSKAWEKYKPVTLPNSNVDISSGDNKLLTDIVKSDFYYLIEKYIIKQIDALNIDKNDSVELLLQSAIIYGEYGNLDQAQTKINKILSLEPSNASALNNAGNIFYVKKKYEKALEKYEKALSFSKDDAGIYLNLSLVNYKLKNLYYAKKNFKKAVELDKNIEIEYKNFKTILEK